MSKQIAMTARPKRTPEADSWVEKRVPSTGSDERVKPKRLTIDIDPKLHKELKISCVQRGIQIADLLRSLIQRDLQAQSDS